MLNEKCLLRGERCAILGRLLPQALVYRPLYTDSGFGPVSSFCQ